MKTDTPRTDEVAWPETGLVEGDFARQLERELTAARAEIERLDVAGIHSCHKDCQRPNCVLRRERDELATCLASEKITRNHIVERASETERELKAVTEQRDGLKQAVDCASDLLSSVTEQRDRLAEALEQILEYQGRFAEEDPESIAREALQSLTTKNYE
jgi:DNA-directed RNA polymerase specialized sigma54-like protein